MPLITQRCSARGAVVIFTLDDVTIRATQAQWIAAANTMRIVIFDNLGQVAASIHTGQTSSPVPLDLQIETVEIVKSDETIKSYISPRFVVYFNGVS